MYHTLTSLASKKYAVFNFLKVAHAAQNLQVVLPLYLLFTFFGLNILQLHVLEVH